MKVTINNQNFNILLLGKIYSGQHKCWTREINFSYILNNPLWGDLHQNSFRRKSFFFLVGISHALHVFRPYLVPIIKDGISTFQCDKYQSFWGYLANFFITNLICRLLLRIFESIYCSTARLVLLTWRSHIIPL